VLGSLRKGKKQSHPGTEQQHKKQSHPDTEQQHKNQSYLNTSYNYFASTDMKRQERADCITLNCPYQANKYALHKAWLTW
jgi:hypothetical protein